MLQGSRVVEGHHEEGMDGVEGDEGGSGGIRRRRGGKFIPGSHNVPRDATTVSGDGDGAEGSLWLVGTRTGGSWGAG